MPLVDLPIGGGFYQSESLPLSAQRCIGLFPVIPQTANAGSKVVLFNSPGIKSFSNAAGVNRGSREMAGISYFVNGTQLYKVESSGTATAIDTISGSGQVSMADNGEKLVIVVPGVTAYEYNSITDTVTEITDTDFRVSDTVCFKDGYFIFTSSDGSVFFNSALNDPLNYRALDFGTAEIDPDKIIACHVVHNELFIIGQETIELFQNIGGSGFPFQRIQGANIQKGARAKFSIVRIGETFGFVGGGEKEKPGVYAVLDSSKAQKISTDAIDKEIQKFSDQEIADCIGFNYFDRGQEIIGFTFTSDSISSRTFCYNATTSKLSGIPTWFEMQSGIDDNRWNVNSIVKAYGKLLVGTTTSAIGELDENTYTELGSTIKRQFTSAPIANQDKVMKISKVKLWMEAGVGLTLGQGEDPIVRMDTSDDGRVFSNDKDRKIGKIGKYGQQTEWRRIGRVPSFKVLRFTITDPVKTIIRKLQMVASTGAGNG